jgi:hypothetical protein
MQRARMVSWVLCASVAGALALPGRLALASEGSKGSEGSNDSSKSSGDSSQNSADSSKNSDQRSEDSSEDSSKDSTKDSTDESSKSKGTTAVSTGLLLVTVGATAVGVVYISRATWKDDQRRVQALVRFLQRNHPLVTRDVVLGEGPMLDGWARSLGLSTGERARVGRALAGSAEQTALLRALDGRIDEGRARSFAASFTRLHQRALGGERVRAIALAAAR